MPNSAPNTVVIAVPIDERAKQNADAVLARLGLTTTEFLRRAVERIARQDQDWPVALIAVEGFDKEFPSGVWRQIEEWFFERLRPDADAQERERFIRQVHELLRSRRRAELADEALVPNQETVAALEAVERGEVESFDDIKDFFAWLHADD
ncbi:MAG: hypothetical protein JO288_13250 [Hyphomicrobiales bacterium]|nr:hypothetical protein [Hyphomicrobiales bacterium]